jgi:hypothetical protein
MLELRQVKGTRLMWVRVLFLVVAHAFTLVDVIR